MADYNPLDDTTRQIINNRIKSSMSMDPSYDQAIQKGQIKQIQPEAFNYGNVVSSAIQNRANKVFEDKQNTINEQQKANYPKTEFNNLLSAGQLGLGAQKYDETRANAMHARRVNEEAQRAQLIGTVLGTGGAIAGTYLGGPAGGAAGSAIGQGVGQSQGG